MFLKPVGRSGIIQYNQAKQRFTEQVSQVPFFADEETESYCDQC